MECYDTNAAVVCEVSGTADCVKLERISVCADCGIAVHPDQVIAQLQGGVVTGLIQALRAKITLKNGRLEQSNFHDFLANAVFSLTGKRIGSTPLEEGGARFGYCGQPEVCSRS